MSDHAETVAAQELEIASLGCEIERLVAEQDGLRARVEQLEAALREDEKDANRIVNSDSAAHSRGIAAQIENRARAALSGLGDAG